jgi:hypothetical protein
VAPEALLRAQLDGLEPLDVQRIKKHVPYCGLRFVA